MKVHNGRLGPCWRLSSLDLDYHLRVEYLSDREELAHWVDLLVSSPLDRDRPLWQFHLFHIDGQSVLLARLHHAMGDGVALMRVLMNLADAPPAHPVRPPGPRPGLGSWILAARRLLRLALAPRDPATILKGPLGSRKLARASRPLRLEPLKARAHELGLNLNDLLMLYLSRALRAYLKERGTSTDSLELHAVLPVDLRRYQDEELGNRFGLVFLSLPLEDGQTDGRQALVKSRLDELKGSPEAAVVSWLIRLLGVLPAWANHLLLKFFGSKATLVATNLPGPRETLYLCGRRLEKIAYWVPTTGRLGLGVSFLSYAGHLQVGVMADAGLMKEPDRLIQLFEGNWAEA